MNELHISEDYEVFELSRARLPKHVRFKRVATPDLMGLELPEVRWIVPGFVPEGLSVLAGRQKLGKTWLAIDWAIAVAAGGKALGGVPCEKGHVLYIDLENGPRRIQRRLRTILGDDRSCPDLSQLEWTHEAPQFGAALIASLEEWRLSVATPRLVVVDVLQRIKPPGVGGRTSYENDYAALADLQRWTTDKGIAVVLLHHTRKGGADDPLEALSGSNGLSACADTTLVLDRQGGALSLYVRGRDVEEKDTSVEFDTGTWTILGDVAEVCRSNQRSAIIEALRHTDHALSPTEIADLSGMKNANVRRLLVSMGRDGEVAREARGAYRLADSIYNPNHVDHKGNAAEGTLDSPVPSAGQRLRGFVTDVTDVIPNE
jgi:hypothetical protein